jgi:hypothetical protein
MFFLKDLFDQMQKRTMKEISRSKKNLNLVKHICISGNSGNQDNGQKAICMHQL